MRFLRFPSLARSLSMRFSLRARLVHGLGIKMPRGLGALRSPRRAVYNYVYNRATISVADVLSGRWRQKLKDDEHEEG